MHSRAARMPALPPHLLWARAAGGCTPRRQPATAARREAACARRGRAHRRCSGWVCCQAHARPRVGRSHGGRGGCVRGVGVRMGRWLQGLARGGGHRGGAAARQRRLVGAGKGGPGRGGGGGLQVGCVCAVHSKRAVSRRAQVVGSPGACSAGRLLRLLRRWGACEGAHPEGQVRQGLRRPGPPKRGRGLRSDWGLPAHLHAPSPGAGPSSLSKRAWRPQHTGRFRRTCTCPAAGVQCLRATSDSSHRVPGALHAMSNSQMQAHPLTPGLPATQHWMHACTQGEVGWRKAHTCAHVHALQRPTPAHVGPAEAPAQVKSSWGPAGRPAGH